MFPDIAELLKELAYLRKNFVNSLETRFEREHAELENLRLRLRPNRLAKIINTRQETAAQLALRLRNAITQKLRNERNELNLLKTGLELGNPKLPLKKGYCMVTAGGHIIRTVKDLKIDTEISIELADGTADAKVTKITEKK